MQYGDFIGSSNNFVDVEETGELNADAVGLTINNADIAFTLLRPTTKGTKYIGLKASADQLGFVGTDVFEFGASSVVVEVNIASGSGVTPLTPVHLAYFEGRTGGTATVPLALLALAGTLLVGRS